MSTNVSAALQIEDGGEQRNLTVEDLNPGTGATEATLDALRDVVALDETVAGVLSVLGTVRDLLDGTLDVRDQHSSLEVLASQDGDDDVLTFTFGSARRLVWVRTIGTGRCYAEVAGTPDDGVGIPLGEDEPHPLPVTTSTLKVWAPTGVTVFAWGYA